MSALDELLDSGLAYRFPGMRDAAITELAQLLSRAAEADALRAERDELKAKANVSVCVWCGQECEKESGAIAEHVIVCEKRPEHAMLAKFEELIGDNSAQAKTIDLLNEQVKLNQESTLILLEAAGVPDWNPRDAAMKIYNTFDRTAAQEKMIEAADAVISVAYDTAYIENASRNVLGLILSIRGTLLAAHAPTQGETEGEG